MQRFIKFTGLDGLIPIAILYGLLCHWIPAILLCFVSAALNASWNAVQAKKEAKE